jgi:Cu(I)/Ag(I) efflux system membrane protein CusA/SilA
MLDFIIKSALRYRMVVLALVALIIVWGGSAIMQLPIDVFPDLNRPTVTIMTEAGGMAPEEVETLITLPLESNLNGLPGVQRIRSSSGVGLSVVYVEFDWGTDIFRNRQLVSEKLSLAAEHFPEGVQPVMGPISSIMGQIQMISLSSEDPNMTPMDLRTTAEWVIRPRLLTIPGVAQVISIGGGLKQYQILFDGKKVKQYQLSLEDIDENLSHVGTNTTGGFLDYDKKEFLVRNLAAVKTIEDLENTVIGVHLGTPILIKNVAEVKIGPRLKRGDGSFMGKPAVIISIQKQPDADTVGLSRQIDKAIDEIRPSLPKGVLVNSNIFKQSDFIEVSIAGVKGKLSYGSVLVTIILLLFLANLRMTAITLTAIPLSFLVTAIVFKLFGMSVNTMTLGGLAIAVGEVVDDAIVDVENVFRRLKERVSKKNDEDSILQIIFEASSEVRNSIVLATVIIGLVFIPLFALEGLEGKLFIPLAIAYVTALVASLFISLTVTPVLCSYFFKNAQFKEHAETKIVKKLKNLDRKVLEWALDKPKIVLGASLALFLGSIALLPFMGKDFLPKFNEGTAMISVISPPGTSLDQSNQIGQQAESLIMKTPEVKFVSRRTGRAELDEHAEGVNVSEIDVSFKDDLKRKRDVILEEIRENLEAIEGVGINVGQPISHRLDHLLSGVNAQLAIKLYGADLTTLRAKAAEIKSSISDVEGLVDLQVEQQSLIPQVKIQLLREETAKYGLNVGEVSKMLELAFGGRIVSQVIEGQRVYDVFYRFDDASRGNLELMKKTPFKTMPDGTRVTLEMIADVYESTGPNQVNRENGMRRIAVYGNVAGRDLGGVVEDIQRQVKEKVKLPEGYYVSYGGQFEAQKSATRRIVLFSVLSVIGIAFVLFAHFKSVMITSQIMLTVPLAFMGGLYSLFIIDRVFSVASLIGLVTLCGIASRNGIMMISHYLHIMKHEGEGFTKEMIIRGSLERLIPVLMTALTAALGLLPLVFAKGQAGSEILHPVAVVIVGGLLSSTILDFIVTPTAFYAFAKNAALKTLTVKKEQIR